MAHITKITDHNKGQLLHKKAEHASSDAPAVSPGGIIASKQKDPHFDIRIYRRKNGTHWCALMLFSQIKPDFAVEAPYELTNRGSRREVDFDIGVLAGAMAERLNELYGDNIDMEKAARFGAAKFWELIAAWDEQTKRGT